MSRLHESDLTASLLLINHYSAWNVSWGGQCQLVQHCLTAFCSQHLVKREISWTRILDWSLSWILALFAWCLTAAVGILLMVLANHHPLKVMSTKVVSWEHHKGSTPAILPAHVCNCLELSKSSSHSGNGVAAIVALLTSEHLWCNLQMPCRHWGPEAGTIHAQQAPLTFAAAQAQRECASLLLMLLEGTNDGQKNHQLHLLFRWRQCMAPEVTNMTRKSGFIPWLVLLLSGTQSCRCCLAGILLKRSYFSIFCTGLVRNLFFPPGCAAFRCRNLDCILLTLLLKEEENL